MKTIKTTCKSHEEWRKERSKSIGASSIGVILGVSRYTTPTELAIRMKEELNGIFRYDESDAMKRGHYLEQGVASWWENETGHKVIKASSSEYLLRIDEIPYMHASPDRTYWIDEQGAKHGKNAKANKGILECKTTKLNITEDNIPLSWQFQLQVQMGIMGAKQGCIAWLNMMTDQLQWRYYDADHDIFNAAVKVCHNFWNKYVIGNETPEPTTQRDVILSHPISDSEKTITADGIALDIIREIKALQFESKCIDQRMAKYKEQLAMMFNDESAMVSEDNKTLVTFKTKEGGMKVDTKRLKELYPDVYNDVAKPTESTRTLLIK